MLNEIVTTAMAVTTALDTASKVSFGAKVGKFISDNKTAVIATGVGVGCAGAATAITIAGCHDAAAKNNDGWNKAVKKHKNSALFKKFNEGKKEEKSGKGDSKTDDAEDDKSEKAQAEQMSDEDMEKAKAEAAAEKAAASKELDVPVEVKANPDQPCDPTNPEKIPIAG